MNDQTHQCPVCRLHYRDEVKARECADYCTAHNACSLEIIQHSLENEKARLVR
jgi:hypothetical protein